MAIDTAAKRASVQAYTFGLMRPPPTGTIGEAARATVTYLYAGLDYDSPVIVPDIDPWLVGRLFLLHTQIRHFN